MTELSFTTPNLGLALAPAPVVGTTAGTVAAGDDSRFGASTTLGVLTSAVGNDSTNDTTALQDDLNAVPAGGTLHLAPNKTYRITAALSWPSGVSIDMHGSSIHQASVNADALVCTDGTNVTLRNGNIKGLTSGSPSGTGRGVVIAKSTGPNVSRITIENMLITSFGGNNVELGNPIITDLSNVDSQFSGAHGFSIHGVNGGASGTSVTLTSCYALGNVKAGYYVDTMTYCTFDACAADSNGIGYECVQCNGIAFVGCGAESQADHSGTVAGYAGYSWKLNAGNGYTLTSCFTYDQRARSVWVTGSARAVSLSGFVENTPNAAATNCLVVDFGSDVAIVGLRNSKANSFNASATISWLPAYTTGPQDSGLLSWAYDPAFSSTGQLTVSGTLYLAKVPVRALEPITKVWWNASTAGASATAGQNFAGVYDSSGNRIGSVGVDAQVTSANTPVSVTLSSPYTPTQPGFVWVALLFNATTPPTLLRTNGSTTATNNAGLSASAYRFATNGTGLTALPSTVTPGSNALGPSIWAGVS